jgi:hypothetical protein
VPIQALQMDADCWVPARLCLKSFNIKIFLVPHSEHFVFFE